MTRRTGWPRRRCVGGGSAGCQSPATNGTSIRCAAASTPRVVAAEQRWAGRTPSGTTYSARHHRTPGHMSCLQYQARWLQQYDSTAVRSSYDRSTTVTTGLLHYRINIIIIIINNAIYIAQIRTQLRMGCRMVSVQTERLSAYPFSLSPGA